MQDAFDDTWNEAIQQLIVWGGVFIGEDAEYVWLCLHLFEEYVKAKFCGISPLQWQALFGAPYALYGLGLYRKG